MSAVVYPQFRVVTGVLNAEGEHDDYDEVMQDVYVARTGRFRLLSDAKTSLNPKTGEVNVVIEVVDNGPEAERELRF